MGSLAMVSDMKAANSHYYVYIIASGLNGFLYTGMTEDLYQDVSEHKCLKNPEYAGWRVTRKLVYIEGPTNLKKAINRKIELQKMGRRARVSLIEETNRDWEDLFYDLNTYLDIKG